MSSLLPFDALSAATADDRDDDGCGDTGQHAVATWTSRLAVGDDGAARCRAVSGVELGEGRGYGGRPLRVVDRLGVLSSVRHG